KGFDVVGVVALHPLEDDQRTVGAAYLAIQNLEHRTKAENGDLVRQKLLNRVLNRILHFADTDGAGPRSKAPKNKLLGKEMGLRATSTAISALVSSRHQKRSEGARNLSPYREKPGQ